MTPEPVVLSTGARIRHIFYNTFCPALEVRGPALVMDGDEVLTCSITRPLRPPSLFLTENGRAARLDGGRYLCRNPKRLWAAALCSFLRAGLYFACQTTDSPLRKPRSESGAGVLVWYRGACFLLNACLLRLPALVLIITMRYALIIRPPMH